MPFTNERLRRFCGWLTPAVSIPNGPGSGFPFPENEVPALIKNHSFFGDFKADAVPAAEFQKLTRFPIVIYYGDFIPKTESTNPHADYWRAAVQMAHRWADAVNRYGDVKVIELPDVGISGNSPFPFAEKNSLQVADTFSAWLHEKSLDARP